MRKLPRPSSFFNSRRASAIIGALVLTGILALAVGTMLSTSSAAIRRSGDKIAYEEAYQTALAGTHAARAWLIDQDLCQSMHGNDATLSNKLKDLVDKSSIMNQQIMEEVETRLKAQQALTGMNLYVSESTSRYTNAGITFEKQAPLSDGRYVVYTFPESPVLNLPAVPGPDEFSDSLTDATPTDGKKNYVEWVRLTTPGTTDETKASLRESTFIIEAKGVSEYAGLKKERVVQQRILIKPNKPAEPLLSATEAIITNGTFSAKAMSSGNVHWAPVLARNDIVNPFFEAITPRTTGNKNNPVFHGWEFKLNQSQKANLAGLHVAESGNNSSFNSVVDKWMQWRTGTAGKIYGGQHGTDYMFEGMPVPANGEFDFFAELMKGTLNTGPRPVTAQNLTLDPKFATAGTSLQNSATYNGLVTYKDGEYSNGALVQGSPAVDQRIDEFFGTMNYEKLKAYAQAHNAYYTYDGSTLRDAAGNKVSLPSMSPGNSDTLAANAAADRMLFIDSSQKSETKPFTNAIKLPSFWKGIVYVNGPIETSGAGSAPDIKLRSPEQFYQYRQTGSSGSGTAKGVFVDGIVIANGTADMGANGAIYGTLAAKGGVITGANFSIFYNAANGEGRLRDTSKGSQPYSLIAGRLYETQVPKS
jgi:hypothetical protein